MKVKILLASFLFVFCLKAFEGSAQSINTQDSLALVDLYNSTNGPGWITHTNWLTTKPVSSWFGITTDSGRVTLLNLVVNNLVGTLPPSLGNLTSLNNISLENNQLYGSIPSSFGSFSRLINLNLTFNQLSGTIPSSFERLPDDANIGLQYNRLNFTGFENLRSKKFLFYGNQEDIPLIKNGNILSVSAGGTLTNNIYQWYKDTVLISTKRADSTFTISSPGDYIVEVTNTLATGLILNSISKTALQDSLALIDFYNSTKGSGWTKNINWLTNKPASTWFGVTVRFGRVKEIFLDSNNLAGNLSPSIGSLSNLNLLSLSSNKITGIIPSSIGNCYNLTNLNLQSNQLSGSIPTALENLVNLESLYLTSNKFSGSIPSFIGNLPKLTGLAISNNQLSGTIPSSLSKLSDLEIFFANNN